MNGSVNALAVKDCELFVGGFFTVADNKSSNGIAHYVASSTNNSAPTITPLAQTLQAGSPSANSKIADANDAEDAKNTLQVQISSDGVNFGNTATLNNVTVTLTDSNAGATGTNPDVTGQVFADLVAACGAMNANFTLQVSDSGGLTSAAMLMVTVNANTPPILTYNNPAAIVTGSGTTVNPATGPSDNGSVNAIVLQNQGTFTGTVMVNNTTGVVTISNAKPAGTHTITIRATDNCGVMTDASFMLTVNCPSVTVNPTNPTLPTGTAGQPYSQNFTATGGNAPYSFTLSAGSLPTGLNLAANGTLSGTPTGFGNFNFTIKATDVNDCFGTQAYTLVINPPCSTITVNPATAPNGMVGTAYSQTFTQTGGTGAITWSTSAGTLPDGLSLNSQTGLLSGTPTAIGNFNFTIKATDANGCMGTQAYTVVIGGNRVQFYPLPAPVRLLDTRNDSFVTGCTTGTGAFTANSTRTQPARTACSTIPANAAAVIGNITVVPSGPGFLTLFPSDATQPTVANSNFKAAEITNNFFTVGLGAADGAFKIFASAATHVVIDLTGYYAPPSTAGLYYHPLPTPVRLIETRPGFMGCFTPPQLMGTGDPNADPALDLPVQGRGPGLPTPCNSLPNDASVLVGNATTVLPSGIGYLTIYPSDAMRPTVASSNYAGSDVINGPFAVKLGADGKFKVYTFATTQLVVDITGYYSANANDANGAGLLFNPLPKPMRLLETRMDFPGFPLTGCYRTNAPLQGGAANIHTQPAWGPCADQPPLAIPATALALVGNVTVINPVAAGFLTFFPGNVGTAPTVATSNYPSPVQFGYNRHYYVGLSPVDGMFKILTQFTTDLIVDVSGYFAP